MGFRSAGVSRRSKNSDIPVIFISALDEVVDKVKGFAAGGVDYITKPFQTEEVLARVETHLTLNRLQKQIEAQNAQLEQEIIKSRNAEEQIRQRPRNGERRLIPSTIWFRSMIRISGLSEQTRLAAAFGMELGQFWGKMLRNHPWNGRALATCPHRQSLDPGIR